MKTHVYVDGFNLFHGALKGTPYKWLNLARLCELLLPQHDIHTIKFFTATLNETVGGPEKVIRQQTYLRALRTIPHLEIIYGHFLRTKVTVYVPNKRPPLITGYKFEEKGSDVKIASHMINDGRKGEYEAAVLISNDSDLDDPVRIVSTEMGLTVGIVNPFQNRASRTLVRHATFVKTIRPGALLASQFPPTIEDKDGTIRKPRGW